MKISIAGQKAHASEVLSRLRNLPEVDIISVFTDSTEEFCLLDRPKISDLAYAHGIPVFPPDYVESVIRKRDMRPDILVLCEWKYLLPKTIYEVTPLGAVNIHDSLLPKLRGSSPMNWAILLGHKHTGATMYQVTERADAGPVFCQIEVPILYTENVRAVLDKMLTAYGEVAVQGIRRIMDGERPQPQDESRATYCAKRIPSDGKINFANSAESIYCLVRALSAPFPGAFSHYNGARFVVREAAIVTQPYEYEGNIPGALIGNRHPAESWILCGSGILSVSSVETDDGKVLTGKQFFQNRNIRVGT